MRALLHVVNLDDANSSAAVLSSQDTGEGARWRDAKIPDSREFAVQVRAP
jgi:hypothetical protein